MVGKSSITAMHPHATKRGFFGWATVKAGAWILYGVKEGKKERNKEVCLCSFVCLFPD